MNARTIILVFIAINIVLLASARLLPFIDLPNHLAEATIYKFHEPGNLLASYYKPTPWYFPNTFHTVFCSLFPSVEIGNKIFHILYIILLQGSVFLVIRQLRGNPWYGVLALLFTYNYNVTFGFVGFAISIPILVILFYAILVYIEQPRFFLNVVISFLLILLFFMHAQNALMGLVIYGCMMLHHYRKDLIRFLIHCVLVPLPLLMIIFAWWFNRDAQEEGSTLGYLIDYYRSDYFQSFYMRFRIVVFDNFQLREGLPGLIIATLFFICVITPVLAARPWKHFAWKKASADVIYPAILFAIIAICYLFAPDKLPGQTPIFQRFCTIAMLSFIILGSVMLRDAHFRWLKPLTIAAVVAYMALWAEYFYGFNRENAEFNHEFFAGVQPEDKLAGLIYDNTYRGRKLYIHFPNYHIVWNHGIAASKIIDYRFGVVRRAAPESELPYYEELIGENYYPQPQYKNLNYLLVRGTAPVIQDGNLSAFSLFRHQGDWKLYVNEKKN